MCSGNDSDCLPRTDNNQDFTCQCVTGFYDTNGNTEAGNCSTGKESQYQKEVGTCSLSILLSLNRSL